MSDHDFCFGETCCSDPLPTAIATAIENAPKFHAGDRVRVSGLVPEINKGTVTAGPLEYEVWVGARRVQRIGYKVKLDKAWGGDGDEIVYEGALTRLDVCPCGNGCTAGEGELHYGPQPTPNDPRIWKGTVAEFFDDAADRIEKAQ